MVDSPRIALKPRSGRIEKLESLRGFAATYVLLHHLIGNYFHQAGTRQFLPFAFGQEVVILFFLVSGFVIWSSVDSSRGIGAWDYFVKRTRRIYPVLIVGLAAAYIAQSIRAGRLADVRWTDLAGNFFMLQDFQAVKPGAFFPPYQENTPLWSLSYEWWFYMLFFPIYRAVPDRAQMPLACALSLLGVFTYAAIPNGISLYLTYFVIWWGGVEMAKEYRRRGTVSFRGQAVMLASIFTVCAVWGFTFFVLKREKVGRPGVTPVVEMRHLASAIIWVVSGLVWRNWLGFRFFRFFPGPFLLVAPISYALYAIHWPILMTAELFKNTLPEPLRVIAILAIIFGVSYLVEVRLQAVINSRTAVLLRGSGRRRSVAMAAAETPLTPTTP